MWTDGTVDDSQKAMRRLNWPWLGEKRGGQFSPESCSSESGAGSSRDWGCSHSLNNVAALDR